MKLSVIITTYNSEEWLKKVLFGYLNQTETDFEVVVADDGSTEKTKLVIDSFSPKFKYKIVHVWKIIYSEYFFRIFQIKVFCITHF